MGKRWSLLIDTPRPGWENMAIDSALLDLADQEGSAFLRLYQWQPHCLSFGRHEPARRRYDVERIRSLQLDCVRRPSGGRAVWHARELTYAVAAPLTAFGGLKQRGAIAPEDYESAESSYRSMKFRVERLQLTYDLMRKGPRDNRIDATLAEFKQAEAGLTKAQWRFENTKVRASGHHSG